MTYLSKTLREKGIEWRGARLTPGALSLLEELARHTRCGAIDGMPEPVEIKREQLRAHCGRGLSASALSNAITQLVAFGLIRRERRRPQAGCRPSEGEAKEHVALTWISPALIAVSDAYWAQRRALRASARRGGAGFPGRIPVQLPLPMPFGSFPSATGAAAVVDQVPTSDERSWVGTPGEGAALTS